MAKNNRATTTDTPAPTPVRITYIHPVALLPHRLQNALIAVSALPYGWKCSDADHRTYGKKYLGPALRAIDLAKGAALGVGQPLRYGMGDRAGVTETELRTGLDALYTGAHDVSSNAPPVVKRRCWDVYDKLGQLYTELTRVAIEPEPIPWPKKLRGFYNALLRVKDGMRTLYEAAEDDAKDPVELWEQVCRTVLADFDEVAADILPQLLCAAEADGSGDLYLDRFPDHVLTCCQELMRWGKRRRERPGTDDLFKPSDLYRRTRRDRDALIHWIGRVLNLDEAKEAHKPACLARIGNRKRGRPRDPRVRVRDRAIVEEYQRDPSRSLPEIAMAVEAKIPGVPCGPEQARKAIARLEKNAPTDAVKRSN